MDTNIIIRKIKQLMKEQGRKPKDFQRMIGLMGARGYHDFVNKRKKITNEEIEKIALFFNRPYDFFIRDEQVVENNTKVEQPISQNEIDLLRDLVASQKKTIAMLEECISKIPKLPQGAPKNKVRKVVKTEKA